MKNRLLIVLILFAIILTVSVGAYIIDLNKNGRTYNIYKLNMAIQEKNKNKIKKLIPKTELNGDYKTEYCEKIEGDSYYDCISPLQTACIYGDYETVKLLIKNGADANNIDKYIGTPPLILAAQGGADDKIAIIKYLIKNGANKNIKDRSGKTALDYAKESNNKNLIKLLQ